MTIAEASKQFDLTTDTLRYYEKIGLIPPVSRTSGGIRNYDENSCKWIELMKCMRQAGVQIDALVEYVALFKEGDSTINARKNILANQKDILEQKKSDIQVSIDHINYKIANYDKMQEKVKNL